MKKKEDLDQLKNGFLKSFKRARSEFESKGLIPSEPKDLAFRLLRSLPAKTQKNILKKTAQEDKGLCMEMAKQLQQDLDLLLLPGDRLKSLIEKIGEETFLTAMHKFPSHKCEEVFKRVPGTLGVRLFKSFQSMKKVKSERVSAAFYQLLQALDSS